MKSMEHKATYIASGFIDNSRLRFRSKELAHLRNIRKRV